MLSTLKEYVHAYKGPFFVFCGILSISIVSFTIGVFYGQKWQQKPLLISPTANTLIQQDKVLEAKNEALEGSHNDATLDQSPELEKINGENMTCLYVGSKTGAKYYPPTCSFAARIKAENLRCFTSDEDAVGKGYERSTAC